MDSDDWTWRVLPFAEAAPMISRGVIFEAWQRRRFLGFSLIEYRGERWRTLVLEGVDLTGMVHTVTVWSDDIDDGYEYVPELSDRSRSAVDCVLHRHVMGES